MSKKGKAGKGKKGEKGGKAGKKIEIVPFEEKEKFTEVQRAFYELTIEDARKKISRRRTHIQNIMEANENIEKELHVMAYEKGNKSAELDSEVSRLEDYITQLRYDNSNMTEEYNTEKRIAEETISDWEQKYTAMCHQLSAEIKHLNGNFHLCEELRENWDEIIIKYAKREEMLAEKERQYEQVVEDTRRKILDENALLKIQLLDKLTLASEDFIGATNASNFNMRLIRENIALMKNIHFLKSGIKELEVKLQQETELCEPNKEGIPILKKRIRQLIEGSQEKLEVINKLTAKVASLKKEYISCQTYREQNILLKEFLMCARYRFKKLRKEAYAAAQKVKSVDHEVYLYEHLTKQYKLESRKFEYRLTGMRSLIERLLLSREPKMELTDSGSREDSMVEMVQQERTNMLVALIKLLQTDLEEIDPDTSSSIMTVDGYDKLTHFDNLFHKCPPSLTSLMDMCVAYIDSKEELKGSPSSSSALTARSEARGSHSWYKLMYTPKEKPTKSYIFDVESGSSFYASTDRGVPEIEIVEEHFGGPEDEEGSSDESWSGASDDKKSKATDEKETLTQVSTIPSDTASSKLPEGTIVDVEFEEELEEVEEEGFFDHIAEDDEYDINLFY